MTHSCVKDAEKKDREGNCKGPASLTQLTPLIRIDRRSARTRYKATGQGNSGQVNHTRRVGEATPSTLGGAMRTHDVPQLVGGAELVGRYQEGLQEQRVGLVGPPLQPLQLVRARHVAVLCIQQQDGG
jgi:hypothetical protein